MKTASSVLRPEVSRIETPVLLVAAGARFAVNPSARAALEQSYERPRRSHLSVASGIMGRFRAATMAIEADVLSAQRGDQQAFTRLVETTCSLVSSIALAIVRDPDLSRDIAQDVFPSAWRDIGKLREPASFLPWLRQVTRHRAYYMLRGPRRRTRHAAEGNADELLEAAVDPRPDPHQRLTSLESRRLVAETIERLPVDAREVVSGRR